MAQIGSSTDRENSKPTEHTVFHSTSMEHWNGRLGRCVACKVAHRPWVSQKTTLPTQKHESRTKRCQITMDANTRHYETELLARAEDSARRTAELSPEANVVTATAL